MIEPTNDLLNLEKEKDVFYTFLIDVGYLIKAGKYSELSAELKLVKNQIIKKEGYIVSSCTFFIIPSL